MDYITRVCDMLEYVNNTIISETYYNELGKVYKVKYSKLYRNEIECVKSVLESNIGNNHNRLLMLKAELVIHKGDTSHTFNLASLLVATISLMCSLLSLCAKNQEVRAGLAIFAGAALGAVIIFWICIGKSAKTNRSKWREYIAVVLEEFEKERFSK